MDINKDINGATVAIIEMIKPVVLHQDESSYEKIAATLNAVINYPELNENDKMIIVENVIQYLIRSCGVNSRLTASAMKLHFDNNKFIN